MGQIVKKYKVLLDEFTTNSDKNFVVDIGESFTFCDERDLISLRSENYMDEIFKEQNPSIDFEKYKFSPQSLLQGIDFYFYKQASLSLTPISYDDSNPPQWYSTNISYKLSSGFEISDVPDSTLFLDSYFKFDFYLDPVSQKSLFSIALPLDGTMLNGVNSKPLVDFHQTIKTEIENIYWLRKPQQLPNVTFTGNTFDVYCLISFFNSKTNKVTNFKVDKNLPNSLAVITKHTIRDRYLLYRLDYSNFTYDILDVDGKTLINNNRIKLYAL